MSSLLGSMDVDKKTWSSLCEILEPTVDDDQEIESVRAELSNNGIIAEVDKPRDFSNIEDIQEDNRDVMIYEDVGLKIHRKVKDRLKKAIKNTPTVCNINMRRLIIDNNNINIVCNVSYSTQEQEHNIFDKYSKLFEENEDFIDNSEEIAYGSINAHESPSDEGLWDFDGTVYKYTDEPYKYWSKGPDTDQPRDMDEWIDFVAENKDEEVIVRNRDEHTIHFHPSKFSIENKHPYISNWIEINNKIKKEFSINSYNSFKLRKVHFNREYSELTLSLVL